MTDRVTITNMVTTKSLTLTTEGDGKYILDEEGIDWGSVPTSLYTYKAPNQIGNEIVESSVESRIVMIVGWLYGTTKQIESGQVEIGKMFVPGHRLRISTRGYYLEGLLYSVPAFGKNVKQNNEYMCRFAITIYCGNPLFIKETALLFEYNKTVPKFRFPFHFIEGEKSVVFDLKEIESVKEIRNEGAAPSGGIITLRCTGESVSNPRLFDIYNPSAFVEINKTLVYNEVVRVNTYSRQQEVVGILDESEEDYFRYWNHEGTWLQFQVGSSFYAIEYEGPANSLEVTIELTEGQYTIEGM